MDKDNTGRISVEKIKDNFIDSNVSGEVLRSIFNEIDINHDGEIDFGKFKDMMMLAYIFNSYFMKNVYKNNYNLYNRIHSYIINLML